MWSDVSAKVRRMVLGMTAIVGIAMSQGLAMAQVTANKDLGTKRELKTVDRGMLTAA